MQPFNNPTALYAAIVDGLDRLKVLFHRYDELTGSNLSAQVDLHLDAPPVAPARWRNGMSTPDERGFVELEAVEAEREEAERGDIVDQQWAKRFGRLHAIQCALDEFTLSEQQAHSVVLNCSAARVNSAMSAGGARMPIWQAFELTRDDIGPRLSEQAVPGAVAWSSALTRGAEVLTPGVKIKDVPGLVKQARTLFRIQNQNVRDWG